MKPLARGRSPAGPVFFERRDMPGRYTAAAGTPYAFFFWPDRMGMTLQELEREWEEAYGYGTPGERVDRARRWLPYYTCLAKDAESRPFDPDTDPNGFIAALTESGALREGDALLDIGAGFGDWALRFARRCRAVTALELNPSSAELIGKRAAEAGIRNIETVTGAWESFVPETKYDVAFTSMCPAVCTVSEIRRMESMASRACCILTVRKGSYDRHRKAMMSELDLHPRGMVTVAETYGRVLAAMVRTVRTVDREVCRAFDVPVEKVLEQYPIYFSVFGVPEADALAFLKAYLARNAENGVLHDESKLCLSLLIWNPDRS